MIDLSGQVALVTGGSRGIGAATAIMLSKAGANVAVVYHKDTKSAIAVVNEIKEKGREAIAYKCTVENFVQCRKTVRKVIKNFRKIDILVNSAGIWEFGAIGKMSYQTWKRTIEINLAGTFNMCNEVVPYMKKCGYGRIINVSSTAGQRGEAFHSHYAASKGGIIAFTKSLGAEIIRQGIWVNCVAPGWVETDMVSSVFKDKWQRKDIFNTIPRGCIASPEEIAGPIVFLTSTLANHIVGEIVNVNGGSVLCG